MNTLNTRLEAAIASGEKTVSVSTADLLAMKAALIAGRDYADILGGGASHKSSDAWAAFGVARRAVPCEFAGTHVWGPDAHPAGRCTKCGKLPSAFRHAIQVSHKGTVKAFFEVGAVGGEAAAMAKAEAFAASLKGRTTIDIINPPLES